MAPYWSHPRSASGPHQSVDDGGGYFLDGHSDQKMIDPEKLAGTDISAHALAALRKSRVEEVVIVGRRGIAQSAFTVPEFTGLMALPDIELSVGPDDMVLDSATEELAKRGELPHAVEQKLRLLEALKNRDRSRRT